MFEIKKAERKATPALIALWGPSGSGKTFTALHIARGLVGPGGKVGLIDTENRRAEFYADEAGGWFHLDLQPPFSPDRYTEAFRAFEAAGVGCIIVDSMSHVWEGEGGVLDMADAQTTRNGRTMDGLAKWKAPKTAYKRLVNSLLRAPCHVIFCLRAKESVKQNGKGFDAEIIKDGLAPICGKGFIYEMTVSALLGQDHKPVFLDAEGPFKAEPTTPSIKAPKGLESVFRRGEYLGEQTGRIIAQWVAGGAAVDHAADEAMRVARDVATFGVERLTQHAGTQGEATKAIIRQHWTELKHIAEQADAENALPSDDPPMFGGEAAE